MTLFDEIMPDVRLINLLDDSLLADCVSAGGMTPSVTQRLCDYARSAQEAGADAALSLCSSVGPAIDIARRLVEMPILKIDDAHTEKAVKGAERIGVLATVATTLRPTVDLIREKAEEQGRKIEIREGLAPSALEALMSGDRARHDEMLIEKAKEIAGSVDVILLAQASMTRLEGKVADETGLPVLSSPRPAIEYAKNVLDRLSVGAPA
jgi:Asp/Glu/hydantoin racemase